MIIGINFDIQNIRQYQASRKRESAFEWFQWLAERLQERDAAAPLPPAYLAHRDWKSR